LQIVFGIDTSPCTNRRFGFGFGFGFGHAPGRQAVDGMIIVGGDSDG
jgi:hypothetical protein